MLNKCNDLLTNVNLVTNYIKTKTTYVSYVIVKSNLHQTNVEHMQIDLDIGIS